MEIRNVMQFPQNAAAGACLRASIAKDHGKLASERQFKSARNANFPGEIRGESEGLFAIPFESEKPALQNVRLRRFDRAKPYRYSFSTFRTNDIPKNR
jgi:hypothetical protein